MFNYCPNCKSDKIQFKENKKFDCENCHFQYYHNVAGAVAVIIKKNNKILFTVRNQNPQKGKLDLPGGFIDPKESAEECCVREIQEELSIHLNIKQLKFLASAPNTYLYKNILYNTIDFFYEIEINENITSFNKKELETILWKNLSEINREDLAFKSQKNILFTFLK